MHTFNLNAEETEPEIIVNSAESGEHSTQEKRKKGKEPLFLSLEVRAYAAPADKTCT